MQLCLINVEVRGQSKREGCDGYGVGGGDRSGNGKQEYICLELCYMSCYMSATERGKSITRSPIVYIALLSNLMT